MIWGSTGSLMSLLNTAHDLGAHWVICEPPLYRTWFGAPLGHLCASLIPHMIWGSTGSLVSVPYTPHDLGAHWVTCEPPLYRTWVGGPLCHLWASLIPHMIWGSTGSLVSLPYSLPHMIWAPIGSLVSLPYTLYDLGVHWVTCEPPLYHTWYGGPLGHLIIMNHF